MRQQANPSLGQFAEVFQMHTSPCASAQTNHCNCKRSAHNCTNNWRHVGARNEIIAVAIEMTNRADNKPTSLAINKIPNSPVA